MNGPVPDPTGDGSWLRSLTPIGAGSRESDREPQVHNFDGLSPQSAARALERIWATRDMIASALSGNPTPAVVKPIVDPEAGAALDERGFRIPVEGQVANPGSQAIAPEHQPTPQPTAQSPSAVTTSPKSGPVPSASLNTDPKPQNSADQDPSRVEAILPEDVKAPERGGPPVEWLENNGTQGSLRIDEYGQRHWRFVQSNGVVIDVTEGGGSDGRDRPWTHTVITEPGQSSPRVDTYDTTGVTVNVDTSASTEVRDLRFQGGDVGVEEHLGGSDGADRPWVQTMQFKPSLEPDLPPTRVFTTTRREGGTDHSLVSESTSLDITGARYNRVEDWTNNRRTDTITELDPATGRTLIYTSIQRLSDRVALLDTRTGLDGVIQVVDRTSVDRWGEPAAYQIRPDGTMWDKAGNRVGIADGKLVKFDAAGNYLSSGTDGVSVRNTDTDNPIRSNGYLHGAFWLTPDEKENVEPLTRVYAPDGGPAKAYFRTPGGELIVQDSRGKFYQVNNAPSVAELSLQIGLIGITEGLMSGGAGALARAGTRLPFPRPRPTQQVSRPETPSPRSQGSGSPETDQSTGGRIPQTEVAPIPLASDGTGSTMRAVDVHPSVPSRNGERIHVDFRAEVELPIVGGNSSPRNGIANSAEFVSPPNMPTGFRPGTPRATDHPEEQDLLSRTLDLGPAVNDVVGVGIHSGGRAGITAHAWQALFPGKTNAELGVIVESLRRKLLDTRDIGRVASAVRSMGVNIDQATVAAIKQYNFNSRGLNFATENYQAWRRLASGRATVSDVRYIVHERAELVALQKSGFNFMGTTTTPMSAKAARAWESNFNSQYLAAHAAALDREYVFLSGLVRSASGGQVKLSPAAVAANDPMNKDAVNYMFVGKIPLNDHRDLAAWRSEGSTMVSIKPAVADRLGSLRTRVTVSELIGLVRNSKADRWTN